MPTNFIADYETVHLATRNFLRFSTACMLVLLTQCIYLKIKEFGLSQQLNNGYITIYRKIVEEAR